MKMLILIFFEIHTDSILVYKFRQIKEQNLGFCKNLKFDFDLDFGLKSFWLEQVKISGIFNGLKYDCSTLQGCKLFLSFFQNVTPKLK